MSFVGSKLERTNLNSNCSRISYSWEYWYSREDSAKEWRKWWQIKDNLNDNSRAKNSNFNI